MGLIEKIKMIASLLPLIIDLVTTIEKSFSATGIGTEKLKFIKEILAMVWDNVIPFSEAWGTIEKVINSIVSIFNTIGWKK